MPFQLVSGTNHFIILFLKLVFQTLPVVTCLSIVILLVDCSNDILTFQLRHLAETHHVLIPTFGPTLQQPIDLALFAHSLILFQQSPKGCGVTLIKAADDTEVIFCVNLCLVLFRAHRITIYCRTLQTKYLCK